MNALDRIQENLRRLKLYRMAEILETRLEEAAQDNNRCYTDFLEELLSEEVSAKREKNLSMRTTMARFPFVKTLESFDFNFQPSVDKKRILELAACRFIPNGENVVLLGPPGVGKTHLAVGLGQEYRSRTESCKNSPDSSRDPAGRRDLKGCQPFMPELDILFHIN